MRAIVVAVIATILSIPSAADDKLAPARNYVDRIRAPDLPQAAAGAKPDASGSSAASFRPQQHLRIKEPPAPAPPPPVYNLGKFDVSVDVAPSPAAEQRIASGQARVLVLGMMSTPDAVTRARELREPKSGEPYDVVVGVGLPSVGRELERVVLRDHLDAAANAEALNSAIVKRFGHPIDAHTVDMHSNGAAVGITAMEKGAFRKVAHVNLMGPDIGFAAQYVAPERLDHLAAAKGIQSIDIHAIRSDIVPRLGGISAAIAVAAGDRHDFVSALLTKAELELASRRDGSLVHLHEYDANEMHHASEYFAVSHYVDQYIAKRGEVELAGAFHVSSDVAKQIWEAATPQERARLLQLAAETNRAPAHVVAAGEPEVGGVLLRFDLARTSTLDEIHVLAELATHPPSQAFALRAGPASATVTSVSLRKLLATGATTLGPLTRVRGYTLAGDDIAILGEVEAGRTAIQLDVLAAATRAIWRDGTFPFISLDPDPATFTGPQKVRIGGLPDELRTSELVRIMLDADYAMKRIHLGEEHLAIAGFRSELELYLESQNVAETMTRFWLAPVPSGPAEIEQAEVNGRDVVLFDSRVRVLTERLVRAGDMLAGTGDVDPIAERAAELFTEHYDEIAAARPIFRDLACVFQVAKLAAIWRARGVKHSLLDQLVARPIARVAVRDHYDGIGPKLIGSTGLAVTGGAQSRTRVAAAAFADTAALGALADVADGQQRTVPLPQIAPVTSKQLKEVDGELATTRGIARWRDLDYAGAEVELTKALDSDPELFDALAYRGLARFARGNLDGAFADIDRAAKIAPALVAFRAMLHAYRGQVAEALADAEAAVARNPEDDAVLVWAARARLYAWDFAGADALLARLVQRTPLDPDASDLRTFVDFLYALGPAAARDRIALLRRVPMPISEALVDGTRRLRRFDFDGAEKAYQHCIELARADDGAWMRERCMFGRALVLDAASQAFAPVDKDRAAALRAQMSVVARELLASHPGWASAALLVARDAPADEALKLFRDIAAGDGSGDPLLDDLRVVLGTTSPARYVGLALWYRLREDHPRQAAEVLHSTIPLLEPPARAMWTTLEMIEKEPPVGALAALRKVERELPRPLPTDAITLWSVGYFYEVYISVEQTTGERERARAAVERYLEATRQLDAVPWEVMTQIAAFRLDISAAPLDDFATRLTTDQRVAELRRASPPPAQLEAALRDMRATIVADERTRSPFEAGFAEATLWTTTDKLVSEITGSESPDRRRRALVAGYRAKLAAAATPMEVRTVALELEILAAALARVGSSAAADPGVAAMQAALAEVQPELAAKRLVRPAPPDHDWQHWQDRSSASAAAMAPPHAEAPSSRRWLWWALAAAAVAVAAAGVVLVRRRSR